MGGICSWSIGGNSLIAKTRALREKRFSEAKKRVADYAQSTEERDKIHSMTLVQLRDALQNGEFTATQVLFAYAHYALDAQDKLNCIAEFLLEAFDEAEALDNKFKSGEKPPLFGVPFSVKANFFLKGKDSCIGLANWLDKPCSEDCSFVILLRQLGAVPFCYTNVPQTLISYCCSNPVYGTTLNPFNPERTPGGSSGGDAALLAEGGTPFATGGDIGGSLRIPAHFCGLTTLMPSQHRFEIKNAHTGLPGHGRLGLGTAVFAKSVDELLLLLRHIIGNADYHRQLMPKSAPLPLDVKKVDEWMTKAREGKLRIGYHFNDGYLKPVPACARVVEECVEKLRAKGNQMIHFQIPESYKAASLLFKSFSSDGGVYYRKLYSENPVDPNVKKFALLLKVPFCVRWLLAFLVDFFSPQLAIMMRSYVRTPTDVRVSQDEIDVYMQEFTDRWLADQLDILLVPAFPIPAVAHRWPSDLLACAFSTALYNMLEFPAGVVPAGKVTAEDDRILADETKWATDSNILLKWMRDASSNSAGLPLGVQVVGLPWEEEKCLAVMKVLEEQVGEEKK